MSGLGEFGTITKQRATPKHIYVAKYETNRKITGEGY
jgi:hypothetical protein